MRNNCTIDSSPSGGLFRLWSVVIAGEAIFVLPFLLPRLFRPVMLDAWGMTNLDIGLAFSAYGIVAVAAYFFGGPLADRFSPIKLMMASLLATAVGGLLLMHSPSPLRLRWIYGYFGMSTILLFWSPMIRLTHDLATCQHQGIAFGVLDAGRGLFAAILATALSIAFAVLPNDPQAARASEVKAASSVGEAGVAALDRLILIAAALVVVSAVLLWVSLRKQAIAESPTNRFRVSRLQSLLSNRGLWLQSFIVLVAYCGYKSIDNLGIYAVDVYGASSEQAAWLTTLAFWIRPLAALSTGWFADQLGRFRSLVACFLAMAVGNGVLALGDQRWLPLAALIVTIAATTASIYGLRGIYFAIFDDMKVAPSDIGTATGIVSVIGFMPDVFFGSLTGYVIDTFPGSAGHRIVFAALSLVALLTAVIVAKFRA